MRDLKWSNDLGQTCEVCDSLTAEEALEVLALEILGDDYYIIDPAGEGQANAIIVEEILRKYPPKKRLLNRLRG